jgi:hypothetical protein
VRVADRVTVERWLKGHGVPNFVDGYASPGRVLPRVAMIALAATVISVAFLFASSDLNAGLVILGGAGIALGAAVVGYLVVATGLLPLAVFGLRMLSRTIMRGGATMVSVLPLLLVAVAFLFLGAETWQSIGRLHGLPFLLTALLFVALGIAFVLRQVRPDLDVAETFDDPVALRAALPKELTWSDDMVTDGLHGGAGELRRGERMNLRAVTTIAQMTVAVMVGLVVFAFFIIFGTLVVSLDTVQSWSTETPQIWWQSTIAGHHYALTSEHLRVSGFLGVFSAFYFVVSASTDQALRANLTERAREHAQTCLAVRAIYRRLG